MDNGQITNTVIVQTSRGPSINGTRLTIYDIMGTLKYGRQSG